MSAARLVVPWFLDQPSPAALALAAAPDEVVTARPGDGDMTERLMPLHRGVAAAVTQRAAAAGHVAALLGDCCQAIPVMAGLARAGLHPSLVWLDAHGDFNTWETTPSGFLGGMPLAMLTGRGDQRLLRAVDLAPIADARVVLSDGRDLDPGERDLVAASGIAHVAPERLLSALPDGPLYVHFDSDIIDSSEAPAFLYPVPGGPSADVMRRLLAALMATGRVIACTTCAAWDTAKDKDGATLRAVTHAMQGWEGA